MMPIATDFVSEFYSRQVPRLYVPDSATATRRADKVLRMIEQIPDADLHGARDTRTGRILFADADQADALIAQAERSDRATEAIHLADEACRIDPRTPSSGASVLLRRACVHWGAGREATTRASLLNANAQRHADAGLWKIAVEQYCAAAALDPVLAWGVNDAAWMTATCPDPGAHHGARAVAMATVACQARRWGNWAMLGTLAAAYARTGDFRRAVSWQAVALRLCRLQSPDGIGDAQTTLDRLRDGHAIVAGAPPIDPSSAELAALARVARVLATPFDTAQDVQDVVAGVEDCGLFHHHWGPPAPWTLGLFLDNFDDATARRILHRLADPTVAGAICYRGLDAMGRPAGPAAAMFFGTGLSLRDAQAAIDLEVRGPDGELLPPIGLYRRLRDAGAAPTSPSLH